MKKFLIMAVLVLLSYSAYSAGVHTKQMSARGQKEMTLLGFINPFGGSAQGAKSMARNKLTQNCFEKHHGKIVALRYGTVDFSEYDMRAHVRAYGNCRYESSHS